MAAVTTDARVGAGAFDPAQLVRALPQAVRQARPAHMVHSPVMFVVEVGAVITTVLGDRGPRRLRLVDHGLALAHRPLRQPGRSRRRGARQGAGRHPAQGAGRARSPAGSGARTGTPRSRSPATELRHRRPWWSARPATSIPGDGDVIEGVASVDESAITGESAPVIRESGGDRSAVTGGTRVLSDRIVVQITAKPGETFIDRMIALVEGAARQKTPNEIALNILLGVADDHLPARGRVTCSRSRSTPAPSSPSIVLVALLVCLIPTTIGALLSAIGIAGMDRLVQRNVLAMSGRAVEAAGDVTTLLLDKTGTITLGNRQAAEFVPVGACRPDAARRRGPAVAAWPTRRPRAAPSWSSPRTAYGLRERHEGELTPRDVRRRSPRRPG